MTDDDRDMFRNVMIATAEDKGATLSAAGIALRFEALRDYPLDLVKQAAVSLARTRKYSTMPSIADFLEHLGGGRVEDIAEVEAVKVWKTIERHGSYATVAFDNPVTQAVIEHGFGGWIKLCGETMVDKQGFFIRDFCRVYGAYARQGMKHGGWLDGRAGGNRVMIGEVELCQAVIGMAKADMQITHVGDGMMKMLLAKRGEYLLSKEDVAET